MFMNYQVPYNRMSQIRLVIKPPNNLLVQRACKIISYIWQSKLIHLITNLNNNFITILIEFKLRLSVIIMNLSVQIKQQKY